MNFDFVPFEQAEELLDWHALTEALEAGHDLPRAEIDDTLLSRGPDTLLSRSAWIDGLGILVKSATVFPGNSMLSKPSSNGSVCVFSDQDGIIEAMIDYHLVTKWKTAGDSLLAAKKLARSDAKNILIIGAGVIAQALFEAYSAGFPEAGFTIWNRSPASANKLANGRANVVVTDDLENAVRRADIVAAATPSFEPLIRGDWLQPGQHVDLIGAYRPDMREADDEALRRSRIFVDSRKTVLEHIGELKTPLEQGVIGSQDVIADYYDLASGGFVRTSDDQITLFKNGGGAHLDLMTSRYILNAWKNR